MTHPLKTQYQELVALTELYLLENYAIKERLFSDPHTFNFFKEEAKSPKYSPPPPSQVRAPPALLASTPAPVNATASLPLRTPPMPSIAKPTQTFQANSSIRLPDPLIASKAKPEADHLSELPEKNPSNKDVAEKSPAKSHKKKSELFELDPLVEARVTDFTEMRKLVTEKIPAQTLLDYIPSDEEARKINTAWQVEVAIPAVVILSFQEAPKQKIFLNNITRAIQQNLAPAALFSAQKFELEGWNTLLQAKELRLIIASDYAIHALPGLMKHYRESQKQGLFYLDKTPLCLLSDLSLYLKEPNLKLPLWKAITAMLKLTSGQVSG